MSILGCLREPSPPARREEPRRSQGNPLDVARAPEVPRPTFPNLGSGQEHTPCFPRAFRATRLRALEGRLELCGVVPPSREGRCYLVDPMAFRTDRQDARDAPSEAPSEPELVPPVQRVELATRGFRGSTRGGTFTVQGAAGRSRTVQARTLAHTSLENAALFPTGDGHYLALMGWRWPDLGAFAIVDPYTLRMQGHAAENPCEGPLEQSR
ncbi:MAG: hypothetical protein HY909_30510 [Deltaproteobacteria bacterium]|nr:hypothetical protein [Deltaproteobacteria bacterium]